MAKQKEKSELEFLRSENKRLKSQNRHLKKEVERSNKRKHLYEELEETFEDEAAEESVRDVKFETNAELCPRCGTKLETVDLVIKQMLMCEGPNCNYRAVKNNV